MSEFETTDFSSTEAEAKQSQSQMIDPYTLSEIRLVNVRYSHVDDKGNVSHSIGQRYAILIPKGK